jgi:hypothetical protein
VGTRLQRHSLFPLTRGQLEKGGPYEQQPGWWQASDGQWYPPQAKPGAFLPIKTKRPVYKRWYFWVLVEQQTLTFAAISGSGTCVCSS